MGADGRRDLGDRVRAARAGRKRPAFAAAVGISVRTLRSIENGESDRYSSNTCGAIERLFGWREGSVDAVISGQEPRLANPANPGFARIHAAWLRLPEECRRAVVDIAGDLLGILRS